MTEEYRTDYPNEPIGDGNPYYRCCACGLSDPQINGRLSGHATDCAWRRSQEDRRMKKRPELIRMTIIDLVTDLMYYDRKEDQELPRGEIEAAIENSELTAEDMVDWFRDALLESLS